MKQLCNLVFMCFLLFSCRLPDMSDRYRPPMVEQSFDNQKTPQAPTYSYDSCWMALPWMLDGADLTPKRLQNRQDEAKVDVFFVYPTLYLGPANPAHPWNAAINDDVLNQRIQESTLKFQASVFNGSCRVFSPKYRQAHISAYFTQDKKAGASALDLAYSDVKQAFSHYIQYWNQGRPFIIAGHSQGTHHAGRLIAEVIEASPLLNQMVAAYLVGMPVPADYFRQIKLCRKPEETGCYCTWNTFAKGYTPVDSEKRGLSKAQVINPLSFDVDKPLVPRAENLGGLSWKFEKLIPGICEAQVQDGWLWVSKPKVPGRAFIKVRNLHVADYNLFYLNMRNNVALRVAQYLNSAENRPIAR